MKGILNFYKPVGKTSAEIVDFFRKSTNKKVGHGGTLDPLAEGVLILAFNEFTKDLDEIKEMEKEYLVTIELGKRSKTFDAEGPIEKVEVKNIPKENEILETLQKFKGVIDQIPPIFSAVKIKGKRAYEIARKGQMPELKPKKVLVKKIELINYNWPFLKLNIVSSAGFYVRSFANDLGNELKCGGYVFKLLRKRVGPFEVEKSITFEDIQKNFLEVKVQIFGYVQGVGMRAFIKNIADQFKVVGYVKNIADGSVEMLFQGKESILDRIIEQIETGPTPGSISKINILYQKPEPVYKVFSILY
jgi:tRNA pseudouridine55 synthase